MPSGGRLHYRRRLKIVVLLLLLAILISLYVSSSARSTQTSDFYTRTKSALENRLQHGADGKPNADAGSVAGAGVGEAAANALGELKDKAADAVRGDGSADAQEEARDGREEVDARQKNDAPTKDRLKEAAEEAKRKANEKAGDLGMREEWKERERAHNERPSEAREQIAPKADSAEAVEKEEVGAQVGTGKKAEIDVDGDGKGDAQVGTGAPPEEEGREKAKEAGRPQDRAEAVRQGKQAPLSEQKEQKPETEEQHRVEVVFNGILKKSPIIIFSKSYCPYSKKAKHILLESYAIKPPPHVVELDLHELGPQLQQSLSESTGRRTVPNVLINGKSIGGGDDIEAMHVGGTLIEKVKTLGGKRIVEMSRVEGMEGQE